MELGATLCTPRGPECERCPLRRECRGRREGSALALPEIPTRGRATAVRVAAAVVRRRNRVLVVRESDDAPRWAGLYVFPYVTLDAKEPSERGAVRAARQHGVQARAGAPLGTLRYTITRFRMTLDAFELRAVTSARGRFHDVDRLDELAMPAPHRRLAKLVSERR
jgi:A/G-specific adenine glycosylase